MFHNPVNASDDSGNWPSWAKKAVAAVAVVAVVAVVAAVTVATAGAGTAIAAVAVGAAKGAAIGMVTGAAIGAASGAVSHRVKTGSWKGAGQAALNGMGDGALSGAISGAVSGGVGGYLNYASSASKIANVSACFIAGTTILSTFSQKDIEDIRIGDYVWATNPETGETELKKVVRTFINETNELVHVYVNNEKIVTTPEHPFYVANQGWIGAIELRAGDKLVLVDGEFAVVEKVQHEILEQPIKVYNFEVEDFHTYYVGDTGVLVHNKCAWNTVRESSSTMNKVKSFTKNQIDAYDNVLTKLASGNTQGLNIHRVGESLAADLPGFGKGRGAGRILYKIGDGIIDIIDVTVKHYKK